MEQLELAVFWPWFCHPVWLCLPISPHPVPSSPELWKSCPHRKRKLKAGLERITVACTLLATNWSHQQVGKLFSWSREGPDLTYNHVLQRMLGQPAVEKHGDEQVPKRWPEDLWCVGERSGGAWVAELGAGAHPP